MRLARTAIGIAAMGAGLVVARMLRGKKAPSEPTPPDPAELIGYPQSHRDASASAEVFKTQEYEQTRRRPV